MTRLHRCSQRRLCRHPLTEAEAAGEPLPRERLPRRSKLAHRGLQRWPARQPRHLQQRAIERVGDALPKVCPHVLPHWRGFWGTVCQQRQALLQPLQRCAAGCPKRRQLLLGKHDCRGSLPSPHQLHKAQAHHVKQDVPPADENIGLQCRGHRCCGHHIAGKHGLQDRRPRSHRRCLGRRCWFAIASSHSCRAACPSGPARHAAACLRS
mmetsp:Transcript_12004/g.30816  ORF Transcript_12004/g.30816 Transcript_12004/m.30816 type:complete len:209 (+) Transcript_12004:92-718(+)